MTELLDFGGVGGIIAASFLLAFVLQWVSLLGLMTLMPLPVRPAPKMVSVGGGGGLAGAAKHRAR